MNEPNLSDIRAFHRDLLTISAAGIALAGGPLDQPATRATGSAWLGRNSSGADSNALRESLLSIEQSLAAACLDGHTLAEALESRTQASPSYVAALQAWLSDDHDPAAFDGWATSAQAACQRKWNLRIALVQPLVWLVVSYIALAFISLVIAPQFLALSRQLNIQPGLALSTVLSIRAAFPVWGVVVPLLIVILTGLLYSSHLPRRWFLRSQPTPVGGKRLSGRSTSACAEQKWNELRFPARPKVTWVLLGGVLVLGVSLCLFGPLIELLYGVAQPASSCLPLGILTPSGS